MMTRIKLYVAVLIGASTALATSLAADVETNSVTTPPMRAGKYPVVQKKKKEDAKKTAEKKNDSKKPYGDEKPFADIVKDMDVIKGVFTFYRKAEDNKIYLEIGTNQFEKTFLFSGSIEQAIGERGFYSA